jgi:hypothetical protein
LRPDDAALLIQACTAAARANDRHDPGIVVVRKLGVDGAMIARRSGGGRRGRERRRADARPAGEADRAGVVSVALGVGGRGRGRRERDPDPVRGA